MFCVAITAHLALHIAGNTVKTLFDFHVLFHFFVTIGTQNILRGFVEGLMTLIAIVFVFNVIITEFTRHNRPFHGIERTGMGIPGEEAK